jgi:hypothetical protein
MAIPSFLRLGFFAEGPVKRGRPCPRPRRGPDTDAFNACVGEMFGEPPAVDGYTGIIYWNQERVLQITLWCLVRRPAVVPRILELQRRTGCQVIRCRGLMCEYAGCLDADELGHCLDAAVRPASGEGWSVSGE